MAKKNNNKKTPNTMVTKSGRKKIPWEKKTKLQKGATFTNWFSVGLLVAWFLSLIVSFFVSIPAELVWGFLVAAIVVGFGWFFFVLIAINVFHKR